MIPRQIPNVASVPAWRLCLGCGACAYVCPDRVIKLADVPDEGIRPFAWRTDCGGCRACLDVCPAYENDHTPHHARGGILPELLAAFGPVLEIWEGHATDPVIRFVGSSGGALTALALYCLERQDMHGVLHIGSDPSNPIRNVTRLSRTRPELLEKTGSRYAPASACDRLDLIEQAPAPCVFIGQPSEVTALRKAQQLRPALDKNVGLALSFFCAGSPSTRGTLDLLKKLGVDPAEVGALRYRGNGWPGNFAVTLKEDVEQVTPNERGRATLLRSPDWEMGRAGDSPAPVGDSPTGPAESTLATKPSLSDSGTAAVPSGGSPVLPDNDLPNTLLENLPCQSTPSHDAATSSRAIQMSYRESWGFLQAYRPYSTHLCPDGTGEDADISCGDPWYREVRDSEPGSSLVVVRTERGREILRGAMAAGYVTLTPATPQKLLDSQKNLINKRAAIWGRLWAFRLLGLPTPKLKGFSLFKLWLRLPLQDKLRSTLGSARRIVSRKYYRPLELNGAKSEGTRAEGGG